MSQQPTDAQPITDTVTRFFAAVEAGQWDASSTLLADHVHVAHGPQWMTLTREDLLTGWKESHAAFTRTTYQLGPPTIEHTGPHEATVRCSSRATLHEPAYLGGRSEVVVGEYTIGLVRSHTGTWRIATIRHDQPG